MIKNDMIKEPYQYQIRLIFWGKCPTVFPLEMFLENKLSDMEP